METGQHFLRFNYTYACRKNASGDVDFFVCIYQGPNPDPYGMQLLQQFLSKESGEAVDVYDVNPVKIARALGFGAKSEREIPGIYIGEEAKQIVENLESLK